MVDNKEWIIIVVAILLIIFIYNNSITFSILQSSPKTFSQYTGRPKCGGGYCSGFPESGIYSPTVEFKLGENNFKFITAREAWCGAGWSCCETVDVYKNGIKIDTVGTGWTGDLSNKNSGDNTKYYDDETCTLETCGDDKTNIELNMMREQWISPGGKCELKNNYVLKVSEDSFILEIEDIKTGYEVGENITLNVTVTNNLAETKGKLKLDYKVSTIIGTLTKTVESPERMLNRGKNHYILEIPSTNAGTLGVTPRIELSYPTSNIVGLSIDKIPVTSEEYLFLGSVIGDTVELLIYGDPDYIIQNCSILGCPEGYDCINDLCVREDINVINQTCSTLGCPSGYDCVSDVCIEKTSEDIKWYDETLTTFGDFEFKVFHLILVLVLVIVIVLISGGKRR